MIKHIKPSYTINQLPADSLFENVPRQVMKAAFSLVKPQPFPRASLVHTSVELSEELGFSKEDLNSIAFKQLVTGQWTPGHDTSFAFNYGGHQFGNWAGQLGDGRAINVGQIESNQGIQQLQLKGAGPTPYSRSGDGFAVLRSSIREHLCSEAMHHLGVPTTRSLSLSLSGEEVMRDMFYNGNPAYEKGAIVCRVAPSFLRFGNFQLFAARDEQVELKQLVDFTIAHHYPAITSTGIDKYLAFFQEVTTRTLDMILHWQRVGFVHGVINTDNMSILGLTIDYGPYGWLEDYDPGWTPNTTDNQHKRYRYGAQPEIGLWNLWQLANALFPLIDASAPLESILDTYKKQYAIKHLEMMRAKLGLSTIEDGDAGLIAQLLSLLPKHETDMTLFFRELMGVNHEFDPAAAFSQLHGTYYNLELMTATVQQEWHEWLSLYVDRLEKESAFAKARLPLMQRTNPRYVLRNYMAQLAIDKAEAGDYSVVEELCQLLRNPYVEQPNMDHWYAKRPDWARNKPGASQLSCSS